MTWHQDRHIHTERYTSGPRSRYIDHVVNSYGADKSVVVPKVRLERLADEIVLALRAFANDEPIPLGRLNMVINELRSIAGDAK